MKKAFITLCCVLGFILAAQAQNSQVAIDTGLLKNATGTAVVPNGGLLQLIASSSGTFAAPTSTSYVGGDNILLGSQAMNSQSGTAGETLNTFTLTLSTSVVAGEKLLLRFYPNLTLSGMPSAPTLGTSYGQVRSDAIEFGSAGGDPTETTWVIPSSGKVDLDYITMNDNGTYANTSAYATGIVGVGMAGVPEPSAGLMCGLGLVVVVGAIQSKRRLKMVQL